MPEVFEEGRFGELVEEDDPEAMEVGVSRVFQRTIDDATRDQVVCRFAVERLWPCCTGRSFSGGAGRGLEARLPQVDRSSRSGSFCADLTTPEQFPISHSIG